MKLLFSFIALMMCLNSISFFTEVDGEFEKKSYVSGNDTLPYQIMYPKNYDASKQYPLVLFLHGAGERGSDNEAQMNLGADLFLNEQNLDDYPAIVVFPQCSADVMWTNRTKRKVNNTEEFTFPVDEEVPRPTQLVDMLISELLFSGKIDTDRVYLMGISMGGIGALEHLYRHPNTFAAAVVICGGHDANLASNYAKIPIWFFHGAKDDVVPYYYSNEVYDQIYRENRNTKYTLYPNANHNSWDNALAEPNLLEWLFKQKK